MQRGRSNIPISHSRSLFQCMRYNDRAFGLARLVNVASWAYETNITAENQAEMTSAERVYSNFVAETLDKAAPYFAALQIKPSPYSPNATRLLSRLKLQGGEPRNVSQRDALHKVVADMSATYSKSTICLKGCYSILQLRNCSRPTEAMIHCFPLGRSGMIMLVTL